MFKQAAVDCFESDLRECLAIIGEAKARSLQEKATVNWETPKQEITQYLQNQSIPNWQRTFNPYVTGVVTDQLDQWSVSLGLEWDVKNLLTEQFLADYTLIFAQPINSTTLDGISAILAQAEREGWSIDRTQKYLRQMFTQWQTGAQTPEEWLWFDDRMPQPRAELIARTETMRASNAGAAEQFKQWGAQYKEWKATQDERTRDDHAEADGQVVLMTEPFEVGGYLMMYPGDMSLGAPLDEVANCRCCLLPIIPEQGLG